MKEVAVMSYLIIHLTIHFKHGDVTVASCNDENIIKMGGKLDDYGV